MDLPPNRSDLFPNVENREKRGMIKRALLRLEVIIPTIRTFHDNCRYLLLGAGIIKDLLQDKERPKKSMYEAMRWSLPETILEEIGEFDFRRVTLERPDKKKVRKFCFMQVFLASIRQFPNLSNITPLQESASKKRDRDVADKFRAAYKYQYLKRAHLHGYRTKKIADGLRIAEDVTVELPAPFIEDTDGEAIERRSGTLYANTHAQLRTQLFLRNLSQIQPESGPNPSVMFV